jgi:hydroxybutyrate-dimer hydrolase
VAEAHGIDTVRLQAVIGEGKGTGKLNGKPAIILQGRSDALRPPHHTSRA